ncbi:MAG TPA: hypothetical protein VEU94_15920 [Terriglobales bacterium]|nr:hypothetical protein [Terriglobales bacterium]
MGVVTEPGSWSFGHIGPAIAEKALRVFVVEVSEVKAPAIRLQQGNQVVIAAATILFLLWTLPLHGREHKGKVSPANYGLVFSTEITSPENEVVNAVESVVNNGIIQGSKEFNKDKYIENATAAASSPLFPEWKEPGKVYYKVRTGVLAPLNFKDSKDQGTLAVRYVISSKDASKTILRIDAVFVEDFQRTVHSSDGSVENAECQEIENQIDSVEAEKKQSQEREKQHQDKLAAQELERKRLSEETSAIAAAQTSAQTLDQRLEYLRHQAERVVKAPGGQLKSAPFHTATNVKALEAGAEVVILIVTPYWYGVETTDGQHGWINRGQLEPLP